MNRRISVLILLVCVILFTLCSCNQRIERETVSQSTTATFEYSGDTGYKLITSEIGKLHSFDSINLELCDDEFVGGWIYRIVFNPNEYLHNNKEVVLLFGESSVSINGKNYKGAGVPYSEILNWASIKYDYFDYELIEN